jgi:hypothetical protein
MGEERLGISWSVAGAGAGRADQVQDLGAVDELELGERHDAIFVERRLEGEVEACKRFDGGEPRHDEGGLDAAVLAQGELLDGKRSYDHTALTARESDARRGHRFQAMCQCLH